jgi:hypothetical protein
MQGGEGVSPPSPARTVFLAALALALFSTLYSIAAWNDWWPRLPPGALHDTDLWAGLIGGAALFVVLLLNGVRGEQRRDAETRGLGDAAKPESEPAG